MCKEEPELGDSLAWVSTLGYPQGQANTSANILVSIASSVMSWAATTTFSRLRISHGHRVRTAHSHSLRHLLSRRLFQESTASIHFSRKRTSTFLLVQNLALLSHSTPTSRHERSLLDYWKDYYYLLWSTQYSDVGREAAPFSASEAPT